MAQRWTVVAFCMVLSVSVCSTPGSGVFAMDPQMEIKVAKPLLDEIQLHGEQNVRANIMVELGSPSEIIADGGDDPSSSCNSIKSRADRTTCMVNALEKFAAQSQQQVRDLLASNPDEYTPPASFLWINNTVSIRKASGKLMRLLAQLVQVKRIRGELVFHLDDMQQEHEEEGAHL